MRRLTIIIITCTLCQFSCNKSEGDLNGHWHIYRVGHHNNSFGEYSTIDIKNDTSGVFDKDVFSDFGFAGTVDYKNKTMLFGGTCLILNFGYKQVGDKLLLNQIEYDEETDITFVGEKCDSSCCDLQADFFKNTVIRIDLASSTGDKKSLQPIDSMQMSLLRSVYVGQIKNAYSKFYKDDYLVSLGGEKIGLDEIDLWRKNCLLKLPDKKRALSTSVIYPDKYTPKSILMDAVEKLLKVDQKPIYLALQGNTGKFEVKYLILYLDNYKNIIDLYY